jgi:hypothetical protein
MVSNFVAHIPHILHMWDDIILELFEDIKTELDQWGQMEMTLVSALEELTDPQDDRQKEVIGELEEFDVIKD